MATICPNCGSTLFFNPATQEVTCRACGSSRPPEEDTTSSVSPEKPVPASSVRIQQKLHDRYVFTCRSCGGKVFVSSQETSTTCIYCGSASVVSSRIAEENRPDFILPFQFTKEQAVEKIREHCRQGFLVPKAFTSIDPETVRGIYIPYWLVDVYHAEAAIIYGEKGDGENMVPFFYGRSGTVTGKDLAIESSSNLRDDFSDQLGSFDLSKLKPFNEEYLLGFYSDRSDISYIQLRRSIRKKTGAYFSSAAIREISAINKRIYKEDHSTLIDKDIRYVLLPVWFVTVNYAGKPHTILVNGESGKVVCGIPWDAKRLRKIACVAGAAIGLLTALFYSQYIDDKWSGRIRGESSTFIIFTIFLSLILSGACYLIGALMFHNAHEQLRLTRDQSVFNYTKKRQG